MADQDEIRALLNSLNDAWLKGRPEDIPGVLGPIFHPRIVTKGPGFQDLTGDRDSCIASYVDFARQCPIRACELLEPTIDVCGDTAVAAYKWAMTYEMNGQEYSETGHEVFVFTRSDGRWLACWRAMLPNTPQ